MGTEDARSSTPAAPGPRSNQAETAPRRAPATPKSWTIHDFDIGRELGRGRFGQVFLAREKSSRKILAIKILTKEQLHLGGVVQQLKREVEIHSRIRHPHILPLYATFQDDTKVYLVLKYAPHGDLFTRLKNAQCGRLDERTAARVMTQLISAIHTCHQHNVVHRDIKPENILLGAEEEVLLADFGWSAANVTASYLSVCASNAHICDMNRRETLCGTLDYLSPEMLNGQKYDASVDIWAIGVLLFELLVGKPAFESHDQSQTSELILNARYRIPLFVSREAKDLIRRFLKKDPADRITLAEAMEHPWLQRYSQERARTPSAASPKPSSRQPRSSSSSVASSRA
ncbi:AUR protein kinase [Saprolegnia diclina VS20]|uniref:Aurora kinase n=1 Tax=Saprolegnia diclina (strain VS20) TaxID=1156394 RepID=T0PWD8_SAPDV|nr:AUR protein kinase [Saprolegnia diclina VS20]EQC26526.1 AUR protein kinase [Saprolegnia diclina VS20]|eukprot:XP_008620019.1 AUR protein kinase [Saprolegnia diclina VS20]